MFCGAEQIHLADIIFFFSFLSLGLPFILLFGKLYHRLAFITSNSWLTPLIPNIFPRIASKTDSAFHEDIDYVDSGGNSDS